MSARGLLPASEALAAGAATVIVANTVKETKAPSHRFLIEYSFGYFFVRWMLVYVRRNGFIIMNFAADVHNVNCRETGAVTLSWAC